MANVAQQTSWSRSSRWSHAVTCHEYNVPAVGVTSLEIEQAAPDVIKGTENCRHPEHKLQHLKNHRSRNDGLP